jgi:hypothetical protein
MGDLWFRMRTKSDSDSDTSTAMFSAKGMTVLPSSVQPQRLCLHLVIPADVTCRLLSGGRTPFGIWLSRFGFFFSSGFPSVQPPRHPLHVATSIPEVLLTSRETSMSCWKWQRRTGAPAKTTTTFMGMGIRPSTAWNRVRYHKKLGNQSIDGSPARHVRIGDFPAGETQKRFGMSVSVASFVMELPGGHQNTGDLSSAEIEISLWWCTSYDIRTIFDRHKKMVFQIVTELNERLAKGFNSTIIV